MESKYLQGLKELAIHLGSKLDTLIAAAKNSKIEIDLGQSSKDLAGAATALKTTADALSNLKGLSSAQADQVKGLASVVRDLAAATKSQVSAADFQKTNLSQVKSMSALLEKVGEAVEKISELKIQAPDTDLSPITSELHELCEKMEAMGTKIEANNPSRLETLIEGLTEAIGKMKLNVPDKFKLDDMQLRTIRSGGSGMGGHRMATGVTVANVALTATNTEYSYQFPANTVSFTMKMRDPAGKLYYAFSSGKMPAGGDSSLYGTVGNGEWRSQDNVEWSRKTIYLGSDTASMTAELTIYTL